MPVTVKHALSVTVPDDPRFANKPSDWNSVHNVTFIPDSSEVIKWISAGSTSASSGTVAFANSNGVTWGMDGSGNITASVAPSGAGLGGLSAGTTEATSGTVSFANSNGVSWGLNGQSLTASVKTDYQSSGPYLTTAALSQDSSKYAGTNGAITGGSITLNTSGVSINLPAYLTTAQPPGAYLTTAALSQDSSKYAGTNFAGTNVSGTMNTSGLSLSVAAPGAGTSLSFANSNGVSWGINASTITATVRTDYAGTNAAITGGSITANTSGISINLPAYLTTARASTDGVGLNTANTNVTWTVNSSGISLNAAGYAGTGTSATNASVTLNSNGLAISVANPGAGGGVALYDGANSITSGTARFTNANGVTFTFNGQTISGSVNTSYRASNDAVGLNAAQTNVTWTVNSSGISLNAGGYAGTNTAMTGGSVTLNTSGISINLPAYLTTAALSGDSSKYAGLGTSATNASITLNTAGLAISVAAPGAGGGVALYDGANSITSGTARFVNANGVSFTFNGQSISGSVQTNYLTTAALSQDSSKYAGINGAITGGSITVNTSGVSVNLPAYLTTAALSGDSSKYAGINFATTSTGALVIGGTMNTSGLTLGVPSFIANVVMSAGTTHQAINNWSFSDANGVSWQLNVKTISASVNTSYRASNDALGLNTAGTNITWTANSSGVSINAAGYAGTGFSGTGATATLDSNGLQISVGTAAPSPVNFSAGAASANLGSVVFSNSGGVTWGLNGSTITATVATNYLTTARASTDAVGLNTAQTNVTWTVNSSGISLNAGGYAGTGTSATNASVTLDTNGLQIRVDAAAGATLSNFIYPPFLNTLLTTQGNSFSVVWPVAIPDYVSASFVRFPAQFLNQGPSATFATTANTSFSASRLSTVWFVLYSQGAGASSGSLLSAYSGSAGITYQNSIQANANGSQWTMFQNVSYPSAGNTSSINSSVATTLSNFSNFSTQLLGVVTGNAFLDIPFATLVSPGAYWALMGWSTTSATQGNANLTSGQVLAINNIYGVSQTNQTFRQLGAATNSSVGMFLGLGSISSGAIGVITGFDMSKISSSASHAFYGLQIMRSA